ncbi:MAG: ABC transporter substrate-binding protein [Desulfobacteraceae bacterium]|jgi:NitT/TauT family transport system substrate-binding protein
MPYRPLYFNQLWQNYPLKIMVVALLWFIIIWSLHHWLNTESSQRKVVKMGYMPVVTNFAAPLLDYASLKSNAAVRFKALKFSSFAEMAQAFRNDEIEVAFIIAPLSIVLRQQGEDVKVVTIGNRHESTFVVHKQLAAKSLKDLVGKTVAVPMRYSGHNLGLLKAIAEVGLTGQINVVEMNPPDMASALSSGALDGYFVGEPFAGQTLKSGTADLLFYAEDIWPGFICNLVLVKQKFIREDTETVKFLVEGVVKSGIWAEKNLSSAAAIASRYWGQPVDLVEYALKTPQGRIVFDQYIPVQEELQYMADLMVRFNLIKTADIDGLVEDRFAREVNTDSVSDLSSILPD